MKKHIEISTRVIIVIVLAVLIAPTWVVLDSIFISDPGCIPSIDTLSVFYVGPFAPGTNQLLTHFGMKNTGLYDCLFYAKFVEYPGQPNENQLGGTWSRVVNSGTTKFIDFYWDNIPTTTIWPLGVKLWWQDEPEPGWGDSNTYQWDVYISQTPPDIGITYTMSILTIPSNCDVTLIGFDTVNSGDAGIAVFEDVDYGLYVVTVSKAGYHSFVETVIVDSDATISMDLGYHKYLMPVLFLMIAGIAIGLIVYCYKKKIIKI